MYAYDTSDDEEARTPTVTIAGKRYLAYINYAGNWPATTLNPTIAHQYVLLSSQIAFQSVAHIVHYSYLDEFMKLVPHNSISICENDYARIIFHDGTDIFARVGKLRYCAAKFLNL